MKKIISTILLMSLVLPSLANYGGGGFGPGIGNAGMGFRMGGAFQLYDENGSLINSEANINTIATALSIATSEMIQGSLSTGYPTEGTRIDPSKSVEMTIKHYGLDKPENAYLREEVLSRAALQAATSSGYKSFVPLDPSDPEKGFKEEFITSERVRHLEKGLENLGLTPPTNIEEAKLVQEVFSQDISDPNKFIEEISSKLTGESKTFALKNGIFKFPFDQNTRKIFTKELLKGDIDQDTLAMLFQQELLTYDMMTGKMVEPNQEMMDLILSKYDIDHKDPFNGQSLLCSQLSFSYMNTEEGKEQMRQAMYDSAIDIDFCIECENQGGFQQIESQYEDSQDGEPTATFQYDESLWDAQKKDMLLQQQQTVEKLIEYGADPTQECADGRMPLDYLEVLVEEGLYEGDNYSVQEVAYGKSSSVPCIESIGSDDYATLCQTSNIISALSNQLMSNDRISKKKDELDTTFIYSEGTDKCNFAMFDKVVKRNGQGMTREISFEVTPKGAHDSFVLKGRDKELFIKELEKISGVKY